MRDQKGANPTTRAATSSPGTIGTKEELGSFHFRFALNEARYWSYFRQKFSMNTKQLFDLTGRVAIVTGGSVGLGRQMAEGLAEMGTNLVLCARKKERCEQAAEELKQLGVKTLALTCDVKNPDQIRSVVEETISQFGRIDILINNAGTSWGAPVEEMRLEQWNKVIETNLTGTFLFSQAVGRVMVPQRRGKILNIASVAGLRGAPPEFQAIGYHASKGGVIAFTKDLACKWGIHNIQVNAIAPGWFPTNMSQVVIERNKDAFLGKIPLRRFGNEHDLKGAAVYLSSDASDYVTGHVLVVDGGQTA
jgi:gluconate 5-dehydrogenase